MRTLPFLALLLAMLFAAPAASAATPIVQPEPSGAGLPDLGTTGTYGAGDIAPAIRAYRRSGAWDRDIDAVVEQARAGILRLVKRGYEIVANLGDQYSDLAGGSYKIANPMYFIP